MHHRNSRSRRPSRYASLSAWVVTCAISAFSAALVSGVEQFDYSGVVTGKVVRAGQPLANAKVTLEDESKEQYEPVSTDQSGVYVLNGVKPGKYKLLVWLPGVEPSRTDVVAGSDVTSIPDVELRGKPDLPVTSSTPTPAPTVVTAITADEARAFVKSFWTAREQGNLQLLMEAFAPQVNYYDDGVRDQNAILKDQKNYLRFYTQRIFELGAIDVVKGKSDDADRVRVRFSFHYKVSGKKQKSGSASELWVLQKSDGKLQIVDCKGKVVRD